MSKVEIQTAWGSVNAAFFEDLAAQLCWQSGTSPEAPRPFPGA
ncbi:hypothetical protein NKDENANG_02321 [Candidatus Entotheonellaceae bacterium PAL068K]